MWPCSPIGLVEQGEVRARDGHRGHVLPERLARAAVDELAALERAALGQRGQPGERRRADRGARPLHRPARLGVEPVDLRSAAGGGVVVAAHARGRRRRGAGRRRRPDPARSRRRHRGARWRPRRPRPRAPRRGQGGWRGCPTGRRSACRPSCNRGPDARRRRPSGPAVSLLRGSAGPGEPPPACRLTAWVSVWRDPFGSRSGFPGPLPNRAPRSIPGADAGCCPRAAGASTGLSTEVDGRPTDRG